MSYKEETLNHYGITKAASDELSDLKKAIAAAKKDKWLDAMKIMNVMERKWRKDRDVSALLANFFHHAEEHGYADDDKHGKAALKILEKMEAAFSAGYPSMAGVKVLRSKRGSSKTAGGTGWPITVKPWKVGPKRIKTVCYDSGAFDNDYLDGLDWRKVEFDKPIPNPYRSNGTLVWWRVYPVGEVGDKRSEYVYGYVMTEWVSGSKGIEIKSAVVVKH